MSSISIESNSNFFLNEYRIIETKQDDFSKFLEIEDFDTILKRALETMSDLEKEIHLKTLEQLEEDGYTADELKSINLYIIAKDEKGLENLELSEANKELVDIYNNLFEQLKQFILEKKEERLKLKPLQTEIFMNDIILKENDIKDGRPIKEHTLNLNI